MKKIKINISYPPLESSKGIPLLGQNRQFQWFNNPTYIYPMVPSYAATLLKSKGHNVFWDDGIAEELTYEEWKKRVIRRKPDIIVLESKTPVIKRHWKIINELRALSLKIGNWKLKIILVGDHITAMPFESMVKSKVDFIATGGDYDFLITNIVDHLTKNVPLEPGIWYREKKEIKNTGHFLLNHNLDDLPLIDRDLTKWKLYAYKNGNYKNTPGTYIYSARDCWWGRCKFCSWTTLYPGKDFRKHSVNRMLNEIGTLIAKYHIKEIMDDSGTFPVGKWLKEFCQGMIERGYHKKIRFDCNMRLNALTQEEYNLMGKAGFRFILYGLESANQKTLDKINKNLQVKQIELSVKRAKKAGLEPHITAMVGYPWETKKEALKTVNLARKLFEKGYVDTLQATILIPYPGTPLFTECKKNKWLLTEDWDHFDQRMAVMKSALTESDIKEITQDLYKSFLTPKFFIRKITSIRNFNDFLFIIRAGTKVIGHLLDFSSK